MTNNQGKAIVIILLCILVALAFFDYPRSQEAARPKVYLISVSRLTLADADVWDIHYAINGVPYTAWIPADESPQGYQDYLSRIGDMGD